MIYFFGGKKPELNQSWSTLTNIHISSSINFLCKLRTICISRSKYFLFEYPGFSKQFRRREDAAQTTFTCVRILLMVCMTPCSCRPFPPDVAPAASPHHTTPLVASRETKSVFTAALLQSEELMLCQQLWTDFNN